MQNRQRFLVLSLDNMDLKLDSPWAGPKCGCQKGLPALFLKRTSTGLGVLGGIDALDALANRSTRGSQKCSILYDVLLTFWHVSLDLQLENIFQWIYCTIYLRLTSFSPTKSDKYECKWSVRFECRAKKKKKKICGDHTNKSSFGVLHLESL